MQRYFHLPNYNLSDKGKVTVKIIGKIIDENYIKLLQLVLQNYMLERLF